MYRHRILNMLCETAEVLGPVYEYDHTKQIEALKVIFGEKEGRDNPYRLAEVMTTAQFPLLFGTVLSRRLMDQYELRRGAWKAYTYQDTTPDFRRVDRYRTTRPGTLFQRGEMGQAQETQITESVIQYGVSEFARTFSITWRVLVNDDLGAIDRVTGEMVDAALMFEDSFVSALYDNAVSQAAMVALGAQYAGTGRISEANLTVAVNAMRTRQDADGNPIMANGLWLIIPPEAEIATQRVLETALTLGSPNNDVNVVRRYIRGYYVDPYIATAAPVMPWYMIADPSSRFNTVTVARLAGWGDTPKLWLRASDRLPLSPSGAAGGADAWGGSWTSKAIEIEVEDIIGGWDSPVWGGVTNFQGLYYSDGTVA